MINQIRHDRRRPSFFFVAAMLLCGVLVTSCVLLVLNRPDRRLATIVPGSSSRPTLVVQVIRPRLGLPLAGLLPPQLFGLDEKLQFDLTSANATLGLVHFKRIEVNAESWSMVLAVNDDGRISSETQIVFDMVFEGSIRKVRAKAGNSPRGSAKIISLNEFGEVAGNFEIELPHCEDAFTLEPIGWPPQPLILYGSFDRLPTSEADESKVLNRRHWPVSSRVNDRRKEC